MWPLYHLFIHSRERTVAPLLFFPRSFHSVLDFNSPQHLFCLLNMSSKVLESFFPSSSASSPACRILLCSMHEWTLWPLTRHVLAHLLDCKWGGIPDLQNIPHLHVTSLSFLVRWEETWGDVEDKRRWGWLWASGRSLGSIQLNSFSFKRKITE